MNPQAQELNEVILAKKPVIFDMLSERGKNIFFPKLGILGQTAQAKGTKINATIGAAIEDDGSPMRLKSIDEKINIDPSKSFPYAPSFGRPDLRKKWQQMIFDKNPGLADKAISLPIVTNALTHALSMTGYLFIDEGDEVIMTDMFWGNYNLTFGQAYGAKNATFNTFKNGAFDTDAFDAKLNEGGIGKKVILLNFPNNPTGYSPTIAEMKTLVSSITAAANKGNKVVVLIDDAYFGLVYEEGVEPESIFTYLADAHDNVLAIKIDGATKEDYVWGFRVGFITYGIKGADAELFDALELKTAGAVRGNISNSCNLSQSLVYEAFESPTYKTEKKEKFDILKSRYDAVKKALEAPEYSEVFTPLPYNSGYFMCVKLIEGINGEEVRKMLIEEYGIGIINLNNTIRVAFSAIAATDADELFKGIYAACKRCKK